MNFLGHELKHINDNNNRNSALFPIIKKLATFRISNW
jgi:hypothetical protein